MLRKTGLIFLLGLVAMVGLGPRASLARQPPPPGQAAIVPACPRGYSFNGRFCQRAFRPAPCPPGCSYALNTPRLNCVGRPGCRDFFGCPPNCPADPGTTTCRCRVRPICPSGLRWSVREGRCVKRPPGQSLMR